MPLLTLLLVAAGLFLIWRRDSGNGRALAGALLLAVALALALAGA